MPSTELFEKASDIFVGKVVESPWRRGSNSTVEVTGRYGLRFSVEQRFAGTVASEVVMPAFESDCSYPFLEGETYLVHAVRRDGVLSTGYVWRPLLISQAGEAVKYIEEVLANRNPGLLYGIIALPDPASKPVTLASTSLLTVILQNKSGDRLRVRVPHDQYYEIVAPPGEYDAWLELDGKVMGERKKVVLQPRKAVLQRLDGAVER